MSCPRIRQSGLLFSAATLAIMATMTGGPTAQVVPPFSAWAVPQNLGPVVNSPATEQHPALSPDGLGLYFSTDRQGGLGGSDLWVSHRPSLDAAWGEPAPLTILNSAASEFAPAFDPTGRWIFFGSERPDGCGGRDLWIAYRADPRTDQGWRPPVNLGCGSLSWVGFDDGPTYFQDGKLGTLFFISDRPGGAGLRDVWMASHRDGRAFGAPVNVPELNSSTDDARPVVRRDGLEFFVTSQRPGSVPSGGAPSVDIWVSTRSTTGSTWSAPVNAVELNTAASEGAPALSRDARTMAFNSNRPGGQGGQDLWFTSRTGGY